MNPASVGMLAREADYDSVEEPLAERRKSRSERAKLPTEAAPRLRNLEQP